MATDAPLFDLGLAATVAGVKAELFVVDEEIGQLTDGLNRAWLQRHVPLQVVPRLNISLTTAKAWLRDHKVNANAA